MKYLFAAVLLMACNSTPNLEGRVEAFMKDSVVVHFNDPKSYEYVSMSADSLFTHARAKDRLQELKHDIEKENSRFNLDKIELGSEPEFNEKILPSHTKILNIINESAVRYQGYLNRPDSLLEVNITVSCRAKNAMGALILNTVNLKMVGNNISYIEQ